MSKELSKQEIESIELAAVKYVNDRWENSDNKAYFNQTACSKDYIAGATEQAIKAKELVEASKEILHLHLCEQEGLRQQQLSPPDIETAAKEYAEKEWPLISMEEYYKMNVDESYYDYSSRISLVQYSIKSAFIAGHNYKP